jgi:hypothetical protein
MFVPRSEEYLMVSVDYIHFNCFCGLDIYYFADLPSGKAPSNVMERFENLLNSFPHMLFSSQDGLTGKCCSCHTEIELPTSQIVRWILTSRIPKPAVEISLRMRN